MRPGDYDISSISSLIEQDTTLRLGFDRADFSYMCMCVDRLLGRKVLPASRYAPDALRNDRSRSTYVDFVARLARDTRLGPDLPTLFHYLMKTVEGRNETPDGKPLGRSRSTKRMRLPFANINGLRSFIIGYASHCPFEPSWHMEERGATRPMRNIFPNNEWGHLVRAYTHPDMYDEDEAPYVGEARRRTRGFASCLDAAKRDELAELRRRYGEDYGRDGRGRDEMLRNDNTPVLSMDEILSGGLPF